jgi:hypothetical protein
MMRRETNKPILGHQVGKHIPLSTIAHRISKQGLHQSSIKIFVCSVDDLFEEPVGLLQLVPEEEVGLTELKTRQIMFLHNSHSEDVGSSKDPASP